MKGPDSKKTQPLPVLYALKDKALKEYAEKAFEAIKRKPKQGKLF